MKIYNATGEQVMESVIAPEKPEVSIQNLPSGKYVIKMQNGWSDMLIKH